MMVRARHVGVALYARRPLHSAHRRARQARFEGISAHSRASSSRQAPPRHDIRRESLRQAHRRFSASPPIRQAAPTTIHDDGDAEAARNFKPFYRGYFDSAELAAQSAQHFSIGAEADGSIKRCWRRRRRAISASLPHIPRERSMGRLIMRRSPPASGRAPSQLIYRRARADLRPPASARARGAAS